MAAQDLGFAHPAPLERRRIMSKGIIRFVAFVTIITVMICSATTAYGESTKSKETKFYDMAEFYGYTITDSYACNGKGYVCEVKLSNSATSFSVYLKYEKKTGPVIFYCKGKTRSLSGIEKILKTNAVERDRYLLLTKKVQTIGDCLEDYAETRGWDITKHFCHIGKKPYDELTFSNGKKSFTVRVTGQLKDKRVVISYKRNGKSSSATKIKNWLDNYAPGADIFF